MSQFEQHHSSSSSIIQCCTLRPLPTDFLLFTSFMTFFVHSHFLFLHSFETIHSQLRIERGLCSQIPFTIPYASPYDIMIYDFFVYIICADIPYTFAVLLHVFVSLHKLYLAVLSFLLSTLVVVPLHMHLCTTMSLPGRKLLLHKLHCIMDSDRYTGVFFSNAPKDRVFFTLYDSAHEEV